MVRFVLATLFLAVIAASPVMSADGESGTLPSTALRDGGLFGQMSTAEAVPPGAIDVGANVGFYDDANAMYGHFRMGIVDNTDFDVRIGVDDTERGDDPHIMLGLSVKNKFINHQDYYLPDIAITGFADYYDTGENSEIWMLGMGMVGSYPVRVSSYVNLTPYGRLSFRAERLNATGYKDTDFDIGLNFGTRYSASERMQFFGEFQVDDQWGFITGINFAIY